MKPIVIIGSGGYAQEVLWIIDEINSITPTWEFLGFIDPAAPDKGGKLLYDRPILGGVEVTAQLPKDIYFTSGIGTPASRKKECIDAEKRGWQAASLIHPSVICAKHIEIGQGTVIGAGSIVAPYAKIGRHCAINLSVTIGHNSSMGDFCVVSPGARISGNVVLEDEVFIGTNATVYIGRRVGAGALLGANSFLVTNLASGHSAIGTPASVFTQTTGAGTCSSREKILMKKWTEEI